MLQKLVEGFRVLNVLVEKASASFITHALQQLSDGRLDVAHEPKINSGPASNVFRIFINLNFLHLIAGEKLRERKVGAEHQHEVGIMNCAMSSAVAEQPRHPNRIRIVVFQPLLAAE